jgi:cbb3-type cytochrome c oxidase subunit III
MAQLLAVLAVIASGWQSAAPMPTPRSEVAATPYKGGIAIVGGFSGSCVNSRNVELFLPATNRWRTLPHLPIALNHAAAAAVGNKLYVAKCGGCHTLGNAGTKGTLGPNLDNAFAGPRRENFKESTIQNVILDQIRDAADPMPRNLVKGQDAQDVAYYVAQVAGVPGKTKPASANTTDGKTIFETNCSSCHTLKAAGSTGTIGPNLDSLAPSLTLAIVTRQVENGGAVMPAFKGQLTPQQIDSVAKFVTDNAGK